MMHPCPPRLASFGTPRLAGVALAHVTMAHIGLNFAGAGATWRLLA